MTEMRPTHEEEPDFEKRLLDANAVVTKLVELGLTEEAIRRSIPELAKPKLKFSLTQGRDYFDASPAGRRNTLAANDLIILATGRAIFEKIEKKWSKDELAELRASYLIDTAKKDDKAINGFPRPFDANREMMQRYAVARNTEDFGPLEDTADSAKFIPFDDAQAA